MFAEAKLYVLAAVVVAFLALGGYAAFEREHAKAESARADQADARSKQLAQSLVQSEADKAELKKAQEALDAALVERDKRERALQIAKAKIAEELNVLKKSLPQEDQVCLDRPLPDAIVQRLRNGSDHGNENGKAESPTSSADPVR